MANGKMVKRYVETVSRYGDEIQGYADAIAESVGNDSNPRRFVAPNEWIFERESDSDGARVAVLDDDVEIFRFRYSRSGNPDSFERVVWSKFVGPLARQISELTGRDDVVCVLVAEYLYALTSV